MDENTAKTPPIFILIIIAFALGWLFTSVFMGSDDLRNYNDVVEAGLGLEFQSGMTFSPQSDSLAKAVGIKNGDVLSSHSSLGEFSEDVYEHSGKPFAFEVMRNGSPVVILIPYLPEF